MSSCCNFASALPRATPCANRVVTTRREPVVTTRKLPQLPWADHWLPLVTAQSDELKSASNPQTVQRDLPQARTPRATSAEAPSGAPGALGQGLNPMNRLAAASAIGANAACRGGQKEDLGTKREWCPGSLVVPATLRRSGRTETLT